MKSEILNDLKQRGSDFISGQEIGQKYGITRAAIWKYMKQLQNEGYIIDSASKNGYRLVSCPDILTYDEISEYLDTRYIGRKIVHYDSVSSTNNKAKALAESGEQEGTVVISESQTEGKGRTGKKWISEASKGILMSIILRPNIDMSTATLVTQIGCAAVGTAICELTNNVNVKWPNDILINGKKVCGILTESSGEVDKTDYIILGIGINVNQDENELPESLSNIATSLKIEIKKKISRQKLVSDIFNEFEKQYQKMQEHKNSDETLDFCRTHSNIIGKNILLNRNGQQSKAQVIDLNRQGQLMVRYKDGTFESISSGNISI
jgi:BirA family transcriptional regulator, biotin operon repressor / biotin---[acetyl-CoA-carboxylase] ligase